MDKADAWTVGENTVTLYYDYDCQNPRDWDGSCLFLGTRGLMRKYGLADEELPDDDEMVVPCPACEGNGWLYNEESASTDIACATCDTEGEVPFEGGMVAWLQQKYATPVVVPVGMGDHSGIWFYAGGGAHRCDPGGWDSGTCGFMLIPRDRWVEWGNDPNDPEIETKMREAIVGEIEELSKWAQGDCYGYVIEDINGDHVDSCWGFVGDECAKQEANAAAEHYRDTHVDKLFDVRLSEGAIRKLIEACEHTFDDDEIHVGDALIETLKSALPKVDA